MTVLEAAAALRERKVSSVELTEVCLRNIETWNPKVNAFLTVTAESALEQARRADAELAAGTDRGPFHGIPIAHKDILCTNGVRTTSGSKVFADYVPNFDATVVQRFNDAGAVMLGKTHMHEHAYGITSNNPHYGPARNPWDQSRIPGGSSGGSGAAVATGMCLFATGTDTGGSIRVPASYCGIVGLKPTYGLVSKHGALPLGFSLDHVGPMAQTVRDAAAALEVMAGYDPLDPASVRRPSSSFMPSGAPALTGVRIVLPQNFYFEKTGSDIRALVLAAAQNAEAAGATFVMGRVPDGDQLNTVAQVTLLSEAASVHEPYLRKRRQDYGADVLALLELGRAVPATHYIQAQRMRKRILGVYLELLKKADCILAPATPIAAPAIGQDEISINGEMEDTRIASTRLCRGVNALGLPSLVIPAGITAEGLPAGLQLIGRPFGEAQLLSIGAAIEASLNLDRRALGFD